MRVLITSDSKFGSILLRGLLRNLGHQVQETDTAGAGALLANDEWQADVVIAALVASRSARQRFGAVAVEIGVALQRGLPVLLVAKPGLSLSFLPGLPRVDYADDPGLLSAQLEILLEAVVDGSPRQSPWLNVASPPHRAMWSASKSAAQAAVFESLVGKLLQGTGAELLEHADLPDVAPGQPDFTLFLPGTVPELGVVLVEAKSVSQRISEDKARVRRYLLDAARSLSERVLSSRAGLGLLVYEGAPVTLPSTPMTVAMTVGELQARLAEERLPEVLRRARNEAIHAL